MSKYLINKFLYTVDRDPELVERYRADPRGTVAWWECGAGQPHPELPQRGAEHLAGLHPTPSGEALASQDYVALFELGAHNFLTLTLFIALFELRLRGTAGVSSGSTRRGWQHTWDRAAYPDIST